ncbi:hypothetical protein ABHF33_01630 [Chitinibacter sp. FCG-7]|uniref:Uncharacterized protein n=1 Tax=Chitinibacter mangrovi TaxID=3153927 RepID=A0AAU7FBT9_9NEIS
MTYQIFVLDVDSDTRNGNIVAWLVYTEEHVKSAVNNFSEVGTPPNGQQQLRLNRLAYRLLQLLPLSDPIWGGQDPRAAVKSLQTKGWLISVAPEHAERLLRAILPLARHLRLAIADLQTGIYFEPNEENKVIPEAALPTLQVLDPDMKPRNKPLTKAQIYEGFAERLVAPLAALGFSRYDPGYSPSCKFRREQNGVCCELSVMSEGRPHNLSAKIKFNVYSERAGMLRAKAEQDLLGVPAEKASHFNLVVSLPAAGEVWTKTGQTISYDFCRSIEEMNWLTEVALQRVPTMLKLSDSIAGINTLNREYLRKFSTTQNSLGQLFDYAYLIWGNQLAEFEELAARQLARQRETGSTYGFDVEKLIAYCRDTLKPDPDGLP